MNVSLIRKCDNTSNTSAENTSRGTMMVRSTSRIDITAFPQERQILDFVSETMQL